MPENARLMGCIDQFDYRHHDPRDCKWRV